MTVRIVLMHATPVAMAPIQSAFADVWPEAEMVNLLDEGLSIDRAKSPQLTEALLTRFVHFGQYAMDMEAQGILVTCSAFGPAIERLAGLAAIPVLKPNEAMFREAVAAGNNIGMLATFAPAVASMTDEFNDYIAHRGSSARLTTVVVAQAIDLLKQGDEAGHNRLVAARAQELAHCDVIMLAHFSTSCAAAEVRRQVAIPVLTAPHAAVRALKTRVKRAEQG